MSGLSGLQIVSLILKNEFDEICPEYKVKSVINKSNKVKKSNNNLVVNENYNKEVEYTLYRAFNDDLNLCKLYLKESPNCVELFKLLNIIEGGKGDRILNTKVISLLLYVLNNNEENNLLTKSNELKITQNVLETFLINIEKIFVNDDVIINYSLKLLIESVKRVNVEYLMQFSEKFDFVEHLGKCHVTSSPDNNYTLINHFRNYFGEIGGNETLEELLHNLYSTDYSKKRGHNELDLYYQNGKLKLVILLLTLVRLNRSYNSQNILNEKVLQLVVSHLKSEHLLTKLTLIHLLVKTLKNNVNNHMIRENNTLLNLVNVINNNLINLMNSSSKEMSLKEGDKDDLNTKVSDLKRNNEDFLVNNLLQSLLKDFIEVLVGSNRFSNETVVGVLLKHKVSMMDEELKESYLTNIGLYRCYLENINVNSCMRSLEDGSALINMMNNYMEKVGRTPKYLTKSVVTSLVMSNTNFESWIGSDNWRLLEGIGRSFRMMVKLIDLKKVNLVPDVKTVLNYQQVLEKVLNNEKTKVNNIILVYKAYKNWLWLLSKYENNLRNTYDPLKLLNIAVVKNNYEYFSKNRVENHSLELKEEDQNQGNELVRIKMELNLNLIKCMYSFGINGNLVLNNQVKYFEVILYNYWVNKKLKIYESECLLKYIKTILNGMIECENDEELEVYIRNLENGYLVRVFLSLYSLIINENVNILYNNNDNNNNNPELNYKCVNCVLNSRFCGNVLLYMLLNMLIMIEKSRTNDNNDDKTSDPLNKDVNNQKNNKNVKCNNCNTSLVSFGNLVWNKESENREELLKEYVIKVLEYYMRNENILKSQILKILNYLNINVERDNYDNSIRNTIKSLVDYLVNNNNNNSNDINNTTIRKNVKIIRKLYECINKGNDEDVTNYIFYYLIKVIKDKDVKVKFNFLRKQEDDFRLSLLYNVSKNNNKLIVEKLVELLKGSEDDYKLTLMLIAVNNVEGLLKNVRVEGGKMIDLILEKLKTLNNCETKCTFFSCNFTKLYYLLRLLYKIIRNNEKVLRNRDNILYNNNFVSKCEFVLNWNFGGENREYYYYGNNIEYKLYLMTLRILEFIFHNSDFTPNNNNTIGVLNEYFKMLKKNYKGSRSCDDLLIKKLIYKILEISEGSRSTSFYMKLVKISNFEVVREEVGDKFKFHGLENRWMFWNEYVVYKRMDNDVTIFGDYSLNMARLQFTRMNGGLSENMDEGLENHGTQILDYPDENESNQDDKKIGNYYLYDMEYLVNYIYKVLLVTFYNNEVPKNVEILLILVLRQMVMGKENDLILNKIIDLMIMTTSEKSLKFILYHIKSNKNNEDNVKILNYMVDKYESLVNVNVLLTNTIYSKDNELYESNYVNAKLNLNTDSDDNRSNNKVNDYNKRKIQNSVKLIIKNSFGKRSGESMIMKKHRNQLLMYSLINPNLVKVTNLVN